MMDSGSWFAIWAMCLRTSFFVMIPRSLLEWKQNRKKEVSLTEETRDQAQGQATFPSFLMVMQDQ